MATTETNSLHAQNSAADTLSSLWKRFAAASSPSAFCAGWLSLQAHMLEGVQSGLLLMGSPDSGPFTPVAVWPNPSISVEHLTPIAEKSLRERRGLVFDRNMRQQDPGNTDSNIHVAYPIEVSNQIHGVVVLEITDRPANEIQEAMRRIHWGAAWLEVMIRRVEAQKSSDRYSRLQRLLDVIATTLEHSEFKPAALAFVTHLAADLDCDRVSLGFRKRKRIRINSLSHSAEFGKSMNAVRAIENAMDESVDQQAVVVYPLPSEAPTLVTRAHAELAKDQAVNSICTVPLYHQGQYYGAITLERGNENPFDETTIELVKTVAAMSGPILDLKLSEDKPLLVKAGKAGLSLLKKLFGPRHFGLKLSLIGTAMVVIFFVFARGDYRVSAPTSLEGTVQRIISAPFNGYVSEAPARPGDVVREGSLLAKLDDRDLKLERIKWTTEQEKFLVQQSEALAKNDRAQFGILQAKIEQAKAQINLLDEQLSRATVVAPFDGVVTSGDLSQSLGTPVERGQGLFEIAPLGGYRVILQVDERDIAQVREDQRGELVLPSIPGKSFLFSVSQITPVSTQKDGRNYFRVEARLDEDSERLRPGMEGVGKIKIDRRRFIWIWTHELIEWIRLKVWSWWP